MKPFDYETLEQQHQRGRKVFAQKIYVSALERGTRDRSPRSKRIEPLPDRIEVKICPQDNYRGRMKYNRTRSIPELCRITLTPTEDNHLHHERIEEVYISQYTHCFDGKIEKPHIVVWKQDVERCHVNHRDSKLCILNSPVTSKSQDFPERPKSAPPGSFLFDFEKMDIPEPLSRRSTSPGMFLENWIGIDETDYQMEDDSTTFRPLTEEKVSTQSIAPYGSLSSSLLVDTFDDEFHDDAKQDLTQQARSLISTLRSTVKPPSDFRKTCLWSVPAPQPIKTIPVTLSREPSRLTQREVQVEEHSKTTYLQASTEEITQKTSKTTKVDRTKTKECTLSERLLNLIGDLEPTDRVSAFKATKETQKVKKKKVPPPVPPKTWKAVKNVKVSSSQAPSMKRFHGGKFEEKQAKNVVSDDTSREFDEAVKVQVPEAEVMNRPCKQPKVNKGNDQEHPQLSDIYSSKATTVSNENGTRRSSLSSQASYKRRLTWAWIEQQRLHVKQDFPDSKDQKLRRTKSADLQIEGLNENEERQESKLKHSKSELSFDQLNAMYDPFDEPDVAEKSSYRNNARILHTMVPAGITKAKSYEQKLHPVTHPKSPTGPKSQKKSFERLTDNGTLSSETEELNKRKSQAAETEKTSKQPLIKISSKDEHSKEAKENSKNPQVFQLTANNKTAQFMNQSGTSSSSLTRIQAKHVEKKKVIQSLSENINGKTPSSAVLVTTNATETIPTKNPVLPQNSDTREKIIDVNENKAEGTKSDNAKQMNLLLNEDPLRVKVLSQSNASPIQKLTARYINEKETKVYRVSSSTECLNLDYNYNQSKTSDNPLLDSSKVKRYREGNFVTAKDEATPTSKENVKIRKTKSEPNLEKEPEFPGNTENDGEEQLKEKEPQHIAKFVVKASQSLARVVSVSDEEAKAAIKDKENERILENPDDRLTITSKERNTREENQNISDVTTEERPRTNSKSGFSSKISSLYPKFKKIKKKLLKNNHGLEETGISENGSSEPHLGQVIRRSDQSPKSFVSIETDIKTATEVHTDVSKKKDTDVAEADENILEARNVRISTPIDLGANEQYLNFQNAAPDNKEKYNILGSPKLTRVTMVSSDPRLREDMKNKSTDSVIPMIFLLNSDPNSNNNEKYSAIEENMTVRKVSSEILSQKDMNKGKDPKTPMLSSINTDCNNNNDITKTIGNGTVSNQMPPNEDPQLKSRRNGFIKAKISTLHSGATPPRENNTHGEKNPALKNVDEKNSVTLQSLLKKTQDGEKNEIGTKIKGFISKVLPFNSKDKRPKEDVNGNNVTEEKATPIAKEIKNNPDCSNESSAAKPDDLLTARESSAAADTEAEITETVRLASDKHQLNYFPEKKDSNVNSGVKVTAITIIDNCRQDDDTSLKVRGNGNGTNATDDFVPRAKHTGKIASGKTIIKREQECSSEWKKSENEKHFEGLTQKSKYATSRMDVSTENRSVKVTDKSIDVSKPYTVVSTVTAKPLGLATDGLKEEAITKTKLQENHEALDSVFTFLNSAFDNKEEKKIKTLDKVSMPLPKTENDGSRREGKDIPGGKSIGYGKIVGYRVDSKDESRVVCSTSPVWRETASLGGQEIRGYGRTGGCMMDQLEQSTILTRMNGKRILEEGKAIYVENKEMEGSGQGYERSFNSFTIDETKTNGVLINTNQERSLRRDSRNSDDENNAKENRRDDKKLEHRRINGAMIDPERHSTILIPAVSMTETKSSQDVTFINIEQETTTVNKENKETHEEKQFMDYRKNRHGVTGFFMEHDDTVKKHQLKYVEKVMITRSRGASEVKREVRGEEERESTEIVGTAIKSDFLKDEKAKRRLNARGSEDFSPNVTEKQSQRWSAGYETPTSSSIKESSDEELLQLIEDQIESENNCEKRTSEGRTTPVPEDESQGHSNSVRGKIIKPTKNFIVTQKRLVASQHTSTKIADPVNISETQGNPRMDKKGWFTLTSDKHQRGGDEYQSLAKVVQKNSPSIINSNSSQKNGEDTERFLDSSAEITNKQDQIFTNSYFSQRSEVKQQSTKKMTNTKTKYLTKKKKLNSQSSEDLSHRLQLLLTDQSSETDSISLSQNQKITSPIYSFSEDSEIDILGFSKHSHNKPPYIPTNQHKYKSLERPRQPTNNAKMLIISQRSQHDYSSDDDFYLNSSRQDYRIHSKTL